MYIGYNISVSIEYISLYSGKNLNHIRGAYMAYSAIIHIFTHYSLYILLFTYIHKYLCISIHTLPIYILHKNIHILTPIHIYTPQ